MPEQDLTWVTGMRMMTTAGDVNIQVGMASHVYLVTQSMQDEYFFSADSELLVVPQERRLHLRTKAGIIDPEPKEIAIIPRGRVHRVEVLKNALPPQWTHMPIGYNGRTSSVVVSETDMRRPMGQVRGKNVPEWTTCRRLDLELEPGAVVGRGSVMGKRIGVDEART